MNFLFTCGGTAGHINPALAVAGVLRDRMPDCGILFVGANGKMETDLVPRAGYDIVTVEVTNIHRSLKPSEIAYNFRSLHNARQATKDARKIIEDFQPDVAIGTGGYVCGRKECIERCAYRLSAPGLGREVGANLGLLTSFYQGLFLAPTVVSSAVRGAVFAAGCYEKLGFRVVPGSGETRRDIIQAVELGSREAMVAFCKGIQSAAPVDSYVTPEPWAMPGYESEVIMAAGAFVQGASIELSADGPIRPPYAVYFQGGLTWFHAKLGILMSIQKLLDAGIIEM